MLDDLISKIAEISGLSEEEIRERVRKKKEELGGLITEEGAAYIVASEIGIDLLRYEIKDDKICDIVPTMTTANVTGKVIFTFKPREFERDGIKGKYASVIIADETGKIRVVLWNKDAELVYQIKEGDILRIRNGLVRENKFGEPEVHVTQNTRIIINPKGVNINVKTPEERLKKIAELKEPMQSVDVVCKVVRIFEPREFTRDDGSRGKVVNLFVGDETGVAKLVLWNEDVSLVETGKISEGDVIKIVRGYVRFRFNEPEINVGRFGKIVLGLKEDIEVKYEKYDRKSIEELRNGDKAEIKAVVVDVFEPKTFEKDGKKGIVVNAVLDDGSACIRGVFYNKMAEILLNKNMEEIETLTESEFMEIKNALLGKEIVVVGLIRETEFGKEILVNDLNLNPNVKEEIRKLLKIAKTIVGESYGD